MNPLVLLAALPLTAAAPTTIAAMKWDRRILLVAAPSGQDQALEQQRRVIARWKAEGEARDITVVEIIGDRVAGAADTATVLRNRYRLPSAGFSVILIGKDGTAKLRSRIPLPAAVLEETIDAMPMRRAGDR